MIITEKQICNAKDFEQLFEAYFRIVRNYIYYKGCEMEIAEDIAQEAFITLWNNCKKVEYKQALFYLKRVANNKFLNIVKHEKIVLEYNKTKTSLINNESPDFLMEEKEFMKKLERAISGLPDKQRTVFLLNRIDKKTYKEIADLVGISVKAVEKRMHNALIIIREKIGNI